MIQEFANRSYQLIIIEDEEVALAGSIPGMSGTNSLFTTSFIIVMIATALVLLVAHLMRVRYYRHFVVDLAGKMNVLPGEHLSWSIRNMKSEIAVMEDDLAEMSLGDLKISV